MPEVIFGWGLVTVLLLAIVYAVFMRQIHAWWGRFKANRIVKREVPAPDDFDEKLREFLER